MRIRWLLAMLAIIFFFVVAFLAWPRKPRFTKAHFDGLRRGMTKDQVIAFLGCSPGIYTHPETLYSAIPDDISAKDLFKSYPDTWCGPDGSVRVVFDESGLLWSADYYLHSDESPTFLQKIREWLWPEKPWVVGITPSCPNTLTTA